MITPECIAQIADRARLACVLRPDYFREHERTFLDELAARAKRPGFRLSEKQQTWFANLA